MVHWRAPSLRRGCERQLGRRMGYTTVPARPCAVLRRDRLAHATRRARVTRPVAVGAATSRWTSGNHRLGRTVSGASTSCLSVGASSKIEGSLAVGPIGAAGEFQTITQVRRSAAEKKEKELDRPPTPRSDRHPPAETPPGVEPGKIVPDEFFIENVAAQICLTADADDDRAEAPRVGGGYDQRRLQIHVRPRSVACDSGRSQPGRSAGWPDAHLTVRRRDCASSWRTSASRTGSR